MMIGMQQPLGAVGERSLQVRIVELGDMRVLMGEAHLGGGIQAPEPVSYTHLDVYKRQRSASALPQKSREGFTPPPPRPCVATAEVAGRAPPRS